MIETARLFVVADGVYLNDVAQSVSISKESGRTPVEGLDGLIGFSDGNQATMIELKLAVPIGGETYPFDARLADGAFVAMQIGVGSKAYVGNMKVMDWKAEQSTGEASSITVTLRGEPKANT